ncbi:peptidoglycan editing factor PgeF [Rhodocyclus gracilis]|uniref:peptidoglycan editing factor PgeF n=1 Tax=Rhodocyclus gracilis TaxID=2929842 RepID=UPI0030F3BD56
MADSSASPAFGHWAADWSAPPSVRTLLTTRQGGFSQGAFAGFNLAMHVADDPRAVAANRALLATALPSPPHWLEQVHGVEVVELFSPASPDAVPPRADAAITRQAGVVCAVLTADCLPVLLCDREGSVVGAAHAGWRGLCGGVIERTVAAMACPPERLYAFFGPAIGSTAFVVGDEVRAAFLAVDAADSAAFRAQGEGKWLADLYALARERLRRLGVAQITGGQACTFRDAERFYSYRRDGSCGRMASLIWRSPAE